MRGWHIPDETYNAAMASVALLLGGVGFEGEDDDMLRRTFKAQSKSHRRDLLVNMSTIIISRAAAFEGTA